MSEDKELQQLDEILEVVRSRYGYDFFGYAQASVRRRLTNMLFRFQLDSPHDLKMRLMNDLDFFDHFLSEMTVNITEMFRDPSLYVSMKTRVLPHLATQPSLKIWNAGCSTGEEMFAIAIMLEEEGLLSRATICGTDINRAVLAKAKEGKFPMEYIIDYTQNYQMAGGKRALEDYYTVEGTAARFRRFLSQSMVFSEHNLVEDGSFGAFSLIICRNVMIYFDDEFQERAIGLFVCSLPLNGFLVLGRQESMMLSKYRDMFEVVDKEEKIYRKIK